MPLTKSSNAIQNTNSYLQIVSDQTGLNNNKQQNPPRSIQNTEKEQSA